MKHGAAVRTADGNDRDHGACPSVAVTIDRVPAIVAFQPIPSDRVLEIAAMFDLDLEERADARHVERRGSIGAACTIPLPRGGIVFITGPSGSGKSMLLRRIAAHLGESPFAAHDIASAANCAIRNDFGFSLKTEIVSAGGSGERLQRAVIDLFDDLSLAQALSLLSRAGLAEARLLTQPAHLLSEGERFRLQLALLLARTEAQNRSRGPERIKTTNSGAVVLMDEFCSPLDRVTAHNVACSLRRWISTTNHTFIAASAHDDLLEFLEPEVLIATSLDGSIAVHTRNDEGLGECLAWHREGEDNVLRRKGIVIEDGSIADYDAMSKYHYRAGRPATIERVFRMVERGQTVVGRFLRRKSESQVVGALVRSYPALSCAMRDRALGHRYRGLSQSQRARIINAEFRTISRVVIDPRFRGGGLASLLVRHALDRPATPCTEALAAMGRAHPFFERAGMQRFEAPLRREDLRLLDALAHAGVGSGEARDLVLPAQLAQRIAKLPQHVRAWVGSEIERWRSACEGLRRRRRATAHDGARDQSHIDDVIAALKLARRCIVSRPVYYLAVHKATAHGLSPRRDKPGG